MKNWYWIPLAAIVGGVAGSWGPREDLRLYKETVLAEQTNRKASGTAGFNAFAQLANIPDVASRRVQTRTNEVAQAGIGADGATNAVPTNAVASAEAPKKRVSGYAREDLKMRIEEAAELWNTRVELAKTQWKTKLGIAEGESAATFDAAIATMNESLVDTMQSMADEIERTGKMTPELSLRLMGDVSRTLAETYDAIGAAVPEDRRDEVSDVPVFEFIDPTVAEPLVSVQDKLDAGVQSMQRSHRK